MADQIAEEVDATQKIVRRRSFHQFLDESREWRRWFAEGWGTFLLVAVAVGSSIMASTSGSVSPAAAAVAPGLMVMAIIYFMGTVSGAHLNPAVTVAFSLRGNFPWHRAFGYIVAQLTGGILAALFLRAMFGPVLILGTTLPGPGAGPIRALAMEIFLTAALVNIILGTSSGARNIGTNGAIAIGGYIVLAGLWAAPVSGASMNPVRTIAPDLVRGDFHTTWIYIVGPLLGSVIGVGFEWILLGKPTKYGSIAAQGTLGAEEFDAVP